MLTRLLFLLFISPILLIGKLNAQNPIPVEPNFTNKLLISSVMTADQVIPTTENDIMAVVGLTVDQNREEIEVNLYTNNASVSLVQVFIRQGNPDNVGPLVLNLTDYIDGNKVNTTITNASESLITDLILGKCYIEIKTYNFSGVAARGHLRLETDDSYLGLVNANNILDAGSDSPAQGIISTHHTPELQNLEVNFFASDLSSPITSAFLHIGDESTSSVSNAMDLTSFVTGNRIYANLNPGEFLSHLKNDNIYLKIYTENYPEGEIRGQLRYSENLIHDAWLSGDQMVPTATGADISGFSVFSLQPDFQNVDYWIFTDHLNDEIVTATLHNGVLGVTSAVIFNFTQQVDGNVIIGNEENMAGELNHFYGLLLSGEVYVNIATTNSPAGLIRGQVYRVARQPHHYKFCTNTTTEADGGGYIAYNRRLNYSHVFLSSYNMDSDLVGASLNEGNINSPGPAIMDFIGAENNYTVDYFWNSNSTPQPFEPTIANAISDESTYFQFATEDYPEGEIVGQNIEELECPMDPGPTDEDSADLELNLDISRVHYVQYDSLVMCFTVTNTGTLPTDEVVVDIPLPNGFVYCYDFMTMGEYDLYNQTWNIGTLAPGETAKLSLGVLAMVGGINVDYFAQIEFSSEYDQDSTPGNDVDSTNDEDDEVATTFIALENGGAGTGNFDVDLELNMTTQQSVVALYENADFAMTVVNNGSDDANHIVIDVTIPDGLAYTSHNVSKGDVTFYNGQWYISTLAAGESATLELELFTLIPSATISYFAQIHAVNEPDVDSTPGNVYDFVASEDDEARVEIMTMSGMPVENELAFVSNVTNETVFPNPAINTINLNFESDLQVESQVVIYSATGQIIMNTSKSILVGFNECSYDVSTLPVGTYFIDIPEVGFKSRFVKK